jgi:hypothetical protein
MSTAIVRLRATQWLERHNLQHARIIGNQDDANEFVHFIAARTHMEPHEAAPWFNEGRPFDRRIEFKY